MQPTHFRAYAKGETISRRNTDQGRLNVAHDVHDPVVEGKITDGVASFTTEDEIAYVSFYVEAEDEAGETVDVCLGRLDGPFPAGTVKADFADVPEEAPLDSPENQIVLDGDKYRLAAEPEVEPKAEPEPEAEPGADRG